MLKETEAEEKRERRDEEARAFGWMGLGDVECWTWLI
jgi:hypothetical protein